MLLDHTHTHTHTHTRICSLVRTQVFYYQCEDILVRTSAKTCTSSFVRTVLITLFSLTQRTNKCTHLYCEDSVGTHRLMRTCVFVCSKVRTHKCTHVSYEDSSHTRSSQSRYVCLQPSEDNEQKAELKPVLTFSQWRI